MDEFHTAIGLNKDNYAKLNSTEKLNLLKERLSDKDISDNDFNKIHNEYKILVTSSKIKIVNICAKNAFKKYDK